MRKIIFILLIIFLFGCQPAEEIVIVEQEPQQIVEQEIIEKVEFIPEPCCCKMGETYEMVMEDRCVQEYKSRCFDKIFCEQKEIPQVCCFYPGSYSKITSLDDCMQTGMRWTEDMEECGQKDSLQEVEAVYPDRPQEVPLLPADKICCIVPMHAYHPYEKAFDTTVQRCEQLKGNILPWEDCYEIVCCNRQGMVSLRKFMDCKTEMATIEPMEKCKGLEPSIV